MNCGLRHEEGTNIPEVVRKPRIRSARLDLAVVLTQEAEAALLKVLEIDKGAVLAA